MAAYELTERFDVHVCNCDTKECQQVIKRLSDAFSSKCKCIAEYTPFGRVEDSFMKYLNLSTYTVVHICEKANSLISSLSIDAAQSMTCVKTSSESVHLTPQANAKFSLSELRQYDISSQAGLEHFVSEVIHHLPKCQTQNKTVVYRSQKSRSAERPHSAYSCSDFPPSQTAGIHDARLQFLEAVLAGQLNKSMGDKTDTPVFTILPNIFGDQPETTSVNVISKSEAFVIPLSSLTTFEQLTEVLDSQCRDFSVTYASYIMQKVLPACYKSSTIEGLVSVAVCKHPALQKRSLTLLEMYCLTRDDSVTTNTSQLNEACSLRTAQNKLIEFAERLSNCIKADVDPEISSSMLHQACNLLLLMQSQIDKSCYEDGTYASDGTSEREQLPQLNCDIRGLKSSRSSPGQSFRLGSTSEKKIPLQHLNSVIKILQEAKKKKKKQEKILPKFLSYVSGGPANVSVRQLIESEPHTQMIVLAECLRQIFIKKGSMYKNLRLLADYVNPKQTKRPSRVFLRMILRGLTHFLHFSIERSKDTSQFCATVMDIFERIWRDGRNEVEDVIRSLMFDTMPSVRQGIVKLFKTRNIYPEKLPYFLIKEVAKILSPCLQVNSWKTRQGWLIVTGKYSDIPALAYIHSIFSESHFDQNKDQLKGLEDRLHMNQLTQLRNLGPNPGLVRLLAFSIKCAPQFYIIEHFSINLQQELKNRRLNQSTFDPLTLLEFVTQAAGALKFCHSQGVIHCNLTASSLFVSNCGSEDRKVTIGCFKMAHKLKSCDGHDIIKTRRYLPARWTAPESLRRSCFSLASDVWMFGHLVYEVMTHGVLPYSDEYGFSEETELVLMFYPQLSLRNPPQLPRERSIASRVWDIIVDCTQLQAMERSPMSEITTRLQNLLAQQRAVTDPKPVNYPKIEGKRQHSTECLKGIPSTSDTIGQYMLLLEESKKRQLSSLIRQYELDKVLIFQTVYKGQQGSAMHFAEDIFNGVLEPLLPPLVIYSKEIYSCAIDCHLPKDEVRGPLWDICASRELGSALVIYIDLCLQWARTLQAIHGRLYALAYFSADSLWVLKRSGKYEIVPVMLSYLWHSASESSCQLEIPTETSIIDKCSPELLSTGIVQESSDVYSFGVLLFQVLHAYSLRDRDGDIGITPEAPSAPTNYSVGQAYHGGNIRSQILQCAFSEDLPTVLIKLIQSCMEMDSCERPKWPEITYTLKSVLNELQGFCKKETQSATVEKLDARCGLSVRNPSDFSDSETDSSVSTTPAMTASRGHSSFQVFVNPSASEDDTTSFISAKPDVPYITTSSIGLQHLGAVAYPPTSEPSSTHLGTMNTYTCYNPKQDSVSETFMSIFDRIKSTKKLKIFKRSQKKSNLKIHSQASSLVCKSQLIDDDEENPYALYSRPSDLPKVGELAGEPMWEDEEWYDEGTYLHQETLLGKSTDLKAYKYESEEEEDIYELPSDLIGDSSEETKVKALHGNMNAENIYVNISGVSSDPAKSIASKRFFRKTLTDSQKDTSEETEVKLLHTTNDESINLNIEHLRRESTDFARSLETETRGEDTVVEILPDSLKDVSGKTQIELLQESSGEDVSLSYQKVSCSYIDHNENKTKTSVESSATMFDEQICHETSLKTTFDSTDSIGPLDLPKGKNELLDDKINLPESIETAELLDGIAKHPDNNNVPESETVSDVQITQSASTSTSSSSSAPNKRNPTDPLPCPPYQEKL